MEQVSVHGCTACGYKGEFKCWNIREKEHTVTDLLWCPVPRLLTFSLVFVASVLYLLLPASSAHHCCFYVFARNLQSYGF